MKLSILVVLIVLGIAESVPHIDSHYSSQIDDSDKSDSVSHENPHSQVNEHHPSQEAESESSHSSSSEESSEGKLSDDQVNLDLTDKEGEEPITNEDEKHEQEKHKSHFWSIKNNGNAMSDEEKKAKADLAKQTVTSKANHIIRKQVLKKASKYTGEDVSGSDEHHLAGKVAVLARDAAIRRAARSMIQKTLSKGVNLVKSKVDIDENDGSLTARDVDLFNERRFARELSFKMANSLVNALSTMVGGAVAQKAINKLHNDPNDDLEDAVDDLDEADLINLAEDFKKDNQKDKHETATRSLFHRKKGKNHDKDKHSKKHKKNKHHKNDGHEGGVEHEEKETYGQDSNQQSVSSEEAKESDEGKDHKSKHKLFRWKRNHDKKQQKENKKKLKQEKKEKEKQLKKEKHDNKKSKKENHESKHVKHHMFFKKHKDSSYSSEENV